MDRNIRQTLERQGAEAFEARTLGAIPAKTAVDRQPPQLTTGMGEVRLRLAYMQERINCAYDTLARYEALLIGSLPEAPPPPPTEEFSRCYGGEMGELMATVIQTENVLYGLTQLVNRVSNSNLV